MSQKDRMPLSGAQHIANDLAAIFAPACERVLIAGSVRRQAPEVHDIELVCLPKFRRVQLDLFGNDFRDISMLDEAIATLEPHEQSGGERLKKFRWHGMPIEVYIPYRADAWGTIATIRTGCADFSKWLVAPRAHGGAAPAGVKFDGGSLWRDGVLIPTPEEADVFAAVGWGWIEPERRKAGLWGRKPKWVQG